MGDAKAIILRPITSREANALVKRFHYSGKVVNNSQFHIGVFLNGKLEGAMQFGPSMDKRKIQQLVRDTAWSEFIELNRMAFSDVLPRNSESRALGIAIRILRKHAPQIKWIVSFSDAVQCGDGAIYRAAGFVLTGIKKNDQTWLFPDGSVVSRFTLTTGKHALASGGASMKRFVEMGAKPIDGYQLRYIYFIDPEYRKRLTVDEIPFERIKEVGAGMYRGEKR